MKSKVLILILTLSSFLVKSQDTNYSEKSKFGYASTLKSLVPFETAKGEFTFFDIEEELYNSIFYKGFIAEKGGRSNYYKLTLLLLKETEITTRQFFDYKIVLNPLLLKTEFSQHLLTIHEAEDATTAYLKTNLLDIVFPENILKKVNDDKNVNLLINTDFGIEHNNKRRSTSFEASIYIEKITGFKMEPCRLIDAPISMTNFKNARLKLRVKHGYDFIFEDNNITNFVNSYYNSVKFNKLWNLKNPQQYVNALQFKNVEGTIKLGGEEKNCKISEIYFFEDIVTGVLDYDSEKEIKKLLQDLGFDSNEIESLSENIVEKSTQRKILGKFYEHLLKVSKKIRVTIDADYDSLKIIFITKSDVDVSGKILYNLY